MKSLQSRLTLIVTLIGVIPIVLIASVDSITSTRSLERQIQHSIHSMARIKEATLQRHMQSVLRDAASLTANGSIQNFARNPVADNPAYAAANSFLSEFQSAHWGVYHHVFIANRNGDVVLSPYFQSPESTHRGQNIRDAQAFDLAFKEPQITDFFGFSERDHYHQLLMYPIKSSADADTAETILVFEIEIGFIQNLLQEEFELGETGHIFLATLQGQPVVRLQSENNNVPDHPGLQQAVEQGSAVGVFQNPDGRSVMGVYRRSSYPWIMVVEIDRSEVYAPVYRNLILIFVITLASIVGILIIARITARLFTNPIRRLVERFAQLSRGEGDLTIRIDSAGQATELNQLTAHVNGFMDYIAQVIRQIHDTSGNTRTTAGTLSRQSAELSDAAQSIAASLEQSTASVEEMNSTIENVAHIIKANSASVNQNTGHIRDVRTDLEQINERVRELDGLSADATRLAGEGEESVGAVNQAIHSIQTVGQQISDILDIINDISDRTNLLSLNASIEAARAGEEGRGFAVVAGEISRLAENTQQSVNSISELIRKTNANVASGVTRVDATLATMKHMAESIHRTAKIITEISGSIRRQMERTVDIDRDFSTLNQSAGEVLNMTDEQLNASGEITNGIQGISNDTESFVRYSSEMQNMAEQLKLLADELDRRVGKFRV